MGEVDSMGMMMARDKNGKLIKSAGRVDAVELPEKSSLPFSKGWFDSSSLLENRCRIGK